MYLLTLVIRLIVVLLSAKHNDFEECFLESFLSLRLVTMPNLMVSWRSDLDKDEMGNKWKGSKDVRMLAPKYLA
jgi:hypothetical protein